MATAKNLTSKDVAKTEHFAGALNEKQPDKSRNSQMPRPGVEPGLEVPETSVMSFSLPGRRTSMADAELTAAAPPSQAGVPSGRNGAAFPAVISRPPSLEQNPGIRRGLFEIWCALDS